MGRTHKKFKAVNQEPSTSKLSSSSSTKQQKVDKTEDDQEDKKWQNENEDNSFIDELPPEMLMKILKYLDIKSLLSSRIVNQKWAAIATEIVKSRENVEILFQYDETLKKCLIGQSYKSIPLLDFIKCMKKSKNFPYTRFLLYVGEGSALLHHEDWNKFISNFGGKIKCLMFLSELSSNTDLIKFTKKLNFLLVSQLPKLEQFGLHFVSNSDKISMASSIQLFPTNPNAQVIPIRLPHLKVFFVDHVFLPQFRGIFTDLLRASARLQKIESFRKSYNFVRGIEIFRLLDSLGKLDCLQTTRILLSTELLAQLKGQPAIPLAFKLKKLNLQMQFVYKDRNSWSDAAVVVSNLFESSKDTLNKLETYPLEFLPDLQLPKFSKLTTLCIQPNHFANKKFLPAGSNGNVMEIFPVLQNLKLGVPWTDLFPANKSIPSFSNLKSLKIPGVEMTKDCIVQISGQCPNLNNFTIYPGSVQNFAQVSTAIWTRMKNLESLFLEIDLDNPADTFPLINSCFTGFSEEECIRLWELIKAEKLSETQGSHEKIPTLKLEAERKNPSILDLKDLRKMTVCLLSSNWEDEENSESVVDENTLAVSEKYAFQLIQNLSYKIEKISTL